MGKFIVIAALFLCCGVHIHAQQGAADRPGSAEQVVVHFFDALAALDANKAKSYCTDDVSILESGEVWTIDSLTIRINSRKAKASDFRRVNKLEFIETKTSGNIAWTSYFNTAVISANNKTVSIKWLKSVVLKVIGNEWKIALLHSTELERVQ